MKQIIQNIVIVSFAVIIGGCSILNTEPYVDSHLDESGNIVLEDTPRMWSEYVFSVDPRIAKEVEGLAPEAWIKTWNDYWLWRIEIFPQTHENRDKYINYIIDRRRQEGLPELVNQAEQK